MTITPSTLTDIEQKAKAATPGRREVHDGEIIVDADDGSVWCIGSMHGPDAVLAATLDRSTVLAMADRIRQLEAALVEACDMLGGYVSDRQFPARYADHDADRLASLRAIAGGGHGRP